MPSIVYNGKRRETAMRCYICGGEIPNGQEAYDTKSERVAGEGGLSRIGTLTVQITLCPACAHERNEVRNAWLWVALGLVFAGIAIAVWQFVP
jgi:hypothetical protein